LKGSEFSTTRKNEQDKSLLLEGSSISGVLSWNLVTETEKNHRNVRKASRNRGPDMNAGLFELEAV
jgi:hypothetical protein